MCGSLVGVWVISTGKGFNNKCGQLRNTFASFGLFLMCLCYIISMRLWRFTELVCTVAFLYKKARFAFSSTSPQQYYSGLLVTME